MTGWLWWLLAFVAGEAGEVPAVRVRIATWNVQNLFDGYDDPWRFDEEVPRSFTTRARKQQVAEVIEGLDADIVCLQEVENRSLLAALVRENLPDSGYSVVLIEGNDFRGIDVALLSRLPVRSASSYRERVLSDGSRFRRDVLHVSIGAPLEAEVLVVHFKSQIGGEKAQRVRLAEAAEAVSIVRELRRRDPDRGLVLAGDFNAGPSSPTMARLRGAGLRDATARCGPTYGEGRREDRLDAVLLGGSIKSRMVEARVVELERNPSDHKPVVVELAWPGRFRPEAQAGASSSGPSRPGPSPRAGHGGSD